MGVRVDDSHCNVLQLELYPMKRKISIAHILPRVRQRKDQPQADAGESLP
jgi:hypothetical protein